MNAANGIGYAVHAWAANGWHPIGPTVAECDALTALAGKDDGIEELAVREVLA